MRLNRSSDFALRLMMLLAGTRKPTSIDAAASRLRLPKSQIMKIAAALAGAGLIESRRGRGGGISLPRPAEDVRIGDVVRAMENDFGVVDCLRKGPCDCVFLPGCRLVNAMRAATESFMAHLDAFTLAEVTPPGGEMRPLHS